MDRGGREEEALEGREQRPVGWLRLAEGCERAVGGRGRVAGWVGVAKLGWRCMRGGFGAGSVAACRRFQPLSERASCLEVICACCEGSSSACMLS